MIRADWFRVVVGLTVAVGGLFTQAWAQTPGSGAGEAAESGSTESLSNLTRSMGMGPQTPVTVLTAPAVQKELKLSEAQKAKVFNLSVAAMEKQRDHFQAVFLGVGGPDGGMNPQALTQVRDAMRRENEQAISRLLDETQRTRFEQIVLRVEGPLAVARPEVADKLRLNDAQRGYVQSIVTQMQRNQFMLVARLRQEAAASQGSIGPAGQAARLRQMMDQVRDGAVQQLSKVVDAKQKAAFNKMLGEPFDLAKLDQAATSAAASNSTSATAAQSNQASEAAESGPTLQADSNPEATSTPTSKSSGSATRKKARSKSKTKTNP